MLDFAQTLIDEELVTGVEGLEKLAGLAALHGVAETTVTNHLAWARRTLRALVMERIRGVTSGERELRDEMRRIWI